MFPFTPAEVMAWVGRMIRLMLIINFIFNMLRGRSMDALCAMWLACLITIWLPDPK